MRLSFFASVEKVVNKKYPCCSRLCRVVVVESSEEGMSDNVLVLFNIQNPAIHHRLSHQMVK